MRMPDVKAKKIKVLAKSLLEELFNVQDFRLADEESNPPEKIFEVILKGRRNHLQVLWIPSSGLLISILDHPHLFQRLISLKVDD